MDPVSIMVKAATTVALALLFVGLAYKARNEGDGIAFPLMSMAVCCLLAGVAFVIVACRLAYITGGGM